MPLNGRGDTRQTYPLLNVNRLGVGTLQYKRYQIARTRHRNETERRHADMVKNAKEIRHVREPAEEPQALPNY